MAGITAYITGYSHAHQTHRFRHDVITVANIEPVRESTYFIPVLVMPFTEGRVEPTSQME